jgi:phosphatidylglycerophosphatase A
MTWSRLIASGCGAGFLPVAPGTAGSFVALLIGAGLILLWPPALLLAILAAVLGGAWAIARAGAGDDPGWVVIDEFAGQWIALLGLSGPGWIGLVCAFALFRALDVLKPGPVGWADRRHGWFGVMADDVIAGAIAAVLLWAARMIWPDAPL